MRKTTKQILLEAADHIERYGKIEESFVDPVYLDANAYDHAPMCAIGALNYVAVGDPLGPGHPAVEARNALCDYVNTFRTEGHIYAWSDSHSAAEVVDGLRGAAASIEEAPDGERQG